MPPPEQRLSAAMPRSSPRERRPAAAAGLENGGRVTGRRATPAWLIHRRDGLETRRGIACQETAICFRRSCPRAGFCQRSCRRLAVDANRVEEQRTSDLTGLDETDRGCPSRQVRIAATLACRPRSWKNRLPLTQNRRRSGIVRPTACAQPFGKLVTTLHGQVGPNR
jgi:hypothetical protein